MAAGGTREQLAYRISADNGWDTGPVQSRDSVLVDSTGPPVEDDLGRRGRREAILVRGELALGPGAVVIRARLYATAHAIM